MFYMTDVEMYHLNWHVKIFTEEKVNNFIFKVHVYFLAILDYLHFIKKWFKKENYWRKGGFLPWSDTPNWQGMGMKWLEECVFRSMCAPLVSIWQPEIEDS